MIDKFIRNNKKFPTRNPLEVSIKVLHPILVGRLAWPSASGIHEHKKIISKEMDTVIKQLHNS